MTRENDLLSLLRSRFATDDPSVLVGVGPDDCALVRTDGRRIAVSTDAFAEGSHFLPDTPPGAVARKALAASLSDLAASGCRARWALVSLCLRRGLPDGWADAFAAELTAAAREFGVAIVGGDTISSERGVFVSVTVIGEPILDRMLTRDGGRPGDVLVVTGELGGSILGRHLRPRPRLREIAALMNFLASTGKEAFLPAAAMDISDGLALDLSRLCRESDVGAIVDAGAVPVSGDARRLARDDGRSPLAHALADGEDFELLLAVPPKGWKAFQAFLSQCERAGDMRDLAPFVAIGTLTKDRALLLRTESGDLVPLEPDGYQHQW